MASVFAQFIMYDMHACLTYTKAVALLVLFIKENQRENFTNLNLNNSKIFYKRNFLCYFLCFCVMCLSLLQLPVVFSVFQITNIHFIKLLFYSQQCSRCSVFMQSTVFLCCRSAHRTNSVCSVIIPFSPFQSLASSLY